MISGSCCCGAVKFMVQTEPTMMGTCHCTRCRKLGASVIVFIKRADLEWVQGRDNVQAYVPPAPYQYKRCFCKTCGSSLGEILSTDDSFPIPANVLDSKIELKNQFHEFIAEKPDWLVIGDQAKQYQHHPLPG